MIPTGADRIIVNGSRTRFKVASYGQNAVITKRHAISATATYNQNVIDKTLRIFAQESIAPVSSGGVVDFYTGNTYGSSGGKTFAVSEGDYIVVKGATATVGNSYDYDLYAIYDSNDAIIAKYNAMASNTAHENVNVIVPPGAAKIVINGNSNSEASCVKMISQNLKEYIDYGGGRWNGKKVGVLGTSVAFGALATTSYMYEASQKLGFEMRMFAVPGLAIQLNSDGTVKEYGSFTATKAESIAGGVNIPDNPITPYVPGGSYNNYYRTFENVFTQENADIDFWVIAVVPNNTDFGLSDWETFNKSSWIYSDSSSFADHRKTFIGALLFVMDQIYNLNPDARMVFVLDSNFTYSQGKSNLETLKAQWNLPIIDLWGKINTSPKSLMKLKSENGTNNHPSTFAHEIMGNMMVGEMMLVD